MPARSFKERRLRLGLPAKVDLDRNIKPENHFPRKPQFGVATAEQVHVSAHRDRIVTAIISLVIPKVCAIVLMLKIHDRWPRDQIRRSAAGTAPVPVANQLRTYLWCSPPRIGRQGIGPALSTVRDRGESLFKDRCVRLIIVIHIRQQDMAKMPLA